MNADNTRTMHCDCGNETYEIKFDMTSDGVDMWAECASCGRPTGTIGIGAEKKRQWLRAND